jgi:TrmH family RNA methyltransferase
MTQCCVPCRPPLSVIRVRSSAVKSSALLLPAECNRLCVVLVRTRNPFNIGAAARAMNNFGFSRLRVVQPYEAAFREARSAVGASAILANAEEYASIADAIADCTLVVGTTAIRHRELRHPLQPLEHGVRIISQNLGSHTSKRKRPLPTSRVALLFGSEKTGLSNDALSHCHWLMHIPTSEDNFSMNLGQAVAVCLYEITHSAKPRARAGKPPRKSQDLAQADDLERLTSLLFEALHASGYLTQRKDSSGNREGGKLAEEKLRRLVRRLALSAEDAKIWLGILRQIAWKLHQ